MFLDYSQHFIPKFLNVHVAPSLAHSSMARAPVFRCNDPLSGFPYQVGFTVGKSLLQKAVRQGLHSCAHSATLAAQRLSSEQKYPALWTNWCNRIRVIAFEDCACCPSAIARVMRIGDDMDPSAAAEIAARLSLVPHSRMGSWLRACFAVQDTKLRAAVLDKYKRAAGAAVIDVAEANDWSWKQSSRSMRNVRTCIVYEHTYMLMRIAGIEGYRRL
jgi:hypothetical protein